jgi:DNA-binding XRE family transcriptional regulator
MQATTGNESRGISATPVRLRVKAFDRRAEQLGAESETAKAELLGTDRKTLWRYREAQIVPKLDLAMRWAKVLGLKVEELWDAE